MIGGLWQPRSADAATIDQLQAQVADLEAQINANDDAIAKLKDKRKTLEGEVATLNLEIDSTNAKIAATDKQIQTLELQIREAEVKLAQQKGILSESMRELYKRGGITTVELLASSDSYSDFVSQQEYLSRLKSSIQDSVAAIEALKASLVQKHDTQADLKEKLEGERTLLDRKRSERHQLLAETQGQEDKYQVWQKNLQSQQAELLAEIVARSQVLTGVGTGSYPWANFRESSWTHWASCTYSDDGDPWGYCYRQCTSYSAWRLYSGGKTPPHNYGNATNWGWAAQADGIPTGSQPQVGSIAVWQGYEGHVAYVEEVYGDGTIRVSEYNAVPALQGRYSQRIVNAADPSLYIYF
jgi:surface antigen